MDVLFWSHGKSFTIEDMARSLKAEDDSLSIDLVQNRGDRVVQKPEGPFREIFDLESPDKWEKLRHLSDFLACSYANRGYLLDACALSRSPRRLSRLGGLLLAGKRINDVLRKKRYDVVQFCFPFHLSDIVPFLEFDVDCPLVVHLWGSDLFRVNDREKLALQKYLLDEACHIIAATPEMGATIKYKFGLGNAKKINKIRIGSKDNIYKEIKNKNEGCIPEEIKHEDEKVVQIGYNASWLNQHKEITSKLGGDSVSERSDVLFVIPMTYNGGEEYIREVRAAADEHLRKYVILEEFLPEKSLAALRARVDIVINTPLTDALNSAMTEALYAGSVVINGSWLPYQDLRRHGFNYETVDDLSEIPGLVSRLLENGVKDLREDLARENEGVREYASWSGVAKQWVSFYKEIV